MNPLLQDPKDPYRGLLPAIGGYLTRLGDLIDDGAPAEQIRTELEGLRWNVEKYLKVRKRKPERSEFISLSERGPRLEPPGTRDTTKRLKK